MFVTVFSGDGNEPNLAARETRTTKQKCQILYSTSLRSANEVFKQYKVKRCACQAKYHICKCLRVFLTLNRLPSSVSDYMSSSDTDYMSNSVSDIILYRLHV